MGDYKRPWTRDIDKYVDGKETPEFHAWRDIKRRCYDTKYKSYQNYGGRGIFMCDEWLNDFHAFLKHIGKRPSKGLSIDRIDNDKGYEPGNVRWATWSQQNNNKRPTTKSFIPGKGVFFEIKRNKWVGQITIKGKRKIKYFDTKEEAISYRKMLELAASQ